MEGAAKQFSRGRQAAAAEQERCLQKSGRKPEEGARKDEGAPGAQTGENELDGKQVALI